MKCCNSGLAAALLALLALPTASRAQGGSTAAALASLPQCAVSCLSDQLPKSACSLTDTRCLCTDESFQAAMTACVLGNCTIREALTTKNATALGCGEPVRDRAREYVAICDAFAVLSSSFVIMRFAYKFWAKLDFGPDDWFALVASAGGAPDAVFNAHALPPNSIGRDAWTLSFDQITTFIRYFYVMEIIYFAEVAFVKLSLLFFYMRIFPAAPVRRLLRATIAFVALFGLVFVFVAIFQCSPIHYYWSSWDGEHQETCLDINAIAWSNAAISIALDLWMLAIPMWQLKSLKLHWKKVGVAIMFCVGTFVTVVSILRLRSLVKFGTHSMNPTWDFFDPGVWSTVEINVGIMCACMPALRLLLVRLFPNLLGTTQKHYKAYPSGQNWSATHRSTWPLATGTTSHVERAEVPPPVDAMTPNQITYQKTYAVEYGDKDNDESQLMDMGDMKKEGMDSARSDSR